MSLGLQAAGEGRGECMRVSLGNCECVGEGESWRQNRTKNLLRGPCFVVVRAAAAHRRLLVGEVAVGAATAEAIVNGRDRNS